MATLMEKNENNNPQKEKDDEKTIQQELLPEVTHPLEYPQNLGFVNCSSGWELKHLGKIPNVEKFWMYWNNTILKEELAKSIREWYLFRDIPNEKGIISGPSNENLHGLDLDEQTIITHITEIIFNFKSEQGFDLKKMTDIFTNSTMWYIGCGAELDKNDPNYFHKMLGLRLKNEDPNCIQVRLWTAVERDSEKGNLVLTTIQKQFLNFIKEDGITVEPEFRQQYPREKKQRRKRKTSNRNK